MATELYIQKYDLSFYRDELDFSDDLPVVVGYLRVSSDIQVDEGHSLDAQLIFIREACQRRFVDGCHLIFVADPGLSGTLFYRRKGHNERLYRPGLTIVTELIEQGIARFLCCYKCDRLCRNLEIWLELEENYLRKYGVEFFAAAEPVSNTDAASKFIADILMANADYAGATIREISQHGKDARRAAGYLDGAVCFGWRWQDERLIPTDQYVGIEPHPEEAPIVKQMIDWYLSGRSTKWIARQLQNLGIRTPRGNSKWSTSSIRKILVNPRHCGLIRNKDGEWVRGAHYESRIIDEATHQAVIDRDYRLNLAPTRVYTEDALLRGLGRCGICGAALRLISDTRSGAQYRCHGKSPEQPHASFGVRVRDLDSWVVDRIGEVAALRTPLDLAKDELEVLFAAQDANGSVTEAKSIADLDSVNSEVSRITEMYQCGDLNKDEYEIIVDEQERDRAAILKRLTDIRNSTDGGAGTQAKLLQALELLHKFPLVWSELDEDEKRGFAYNLVDNLVLLPEDRGIKVSLKLVIGDLIQLTNLPFSGQMAGKSRDVPLAILRFAYWLMQGYSVRDATLQCRISVSTAETYVSQLIRFTECRDFPEALELVAPLVNAQSDGLKDYANRRPVWDLELTEQEKQILEKVSQGLSSAEIAQLLSDKRFSVDGMRKEIYFKLGAANAKEAIDIAVSKKLIPRHTPRVKPPDGINLRVLQLHAAGENRKRIAELLDIKLENVHFRLRYMARKYGLMKTADLTDLAAREGWVQNSEH